MVSMTKWHVPCLFVLLAGCAAHDARLASTRMIGVSRLDMEACAGIPARTATVGAAEVDEYHYDAKGVGLTMALPLLGTLALSNAGQCTAVWTLESGRVASLRYTAAASGLDAPETACGALVKGCLSMMKERPSLRPVTLLAPRLSRAVWNGG